MEKLQVLVVDDSAFMRKMISDLLNEHPRLTVQATARNGKEAIEKTMALKPDVITLDVEMPEMNGLEALKAIMNEMPTPVVMLSSLTDAGAKETIEALQIGAVDFIQKPSGSISLDLHKVRELLHEKVIAAATTQVKRLAKPSKLPKPSKPPSSLPQQEPAGRKPGLRMSFSHLVAIGTSTGGPRALQQLLTGIPENFPAPILIVQHMPPKFTQSLAQRLNAVCRITVVEAEEGMPLSAGMAYIAPGGWHMGVREKGDNRYTIRLNKDSPRSGHRPSVDALYESLLPLRQLTLHAVLLTGMGSDGARGMKALLDAGAATTIAESEETSVIYGMPRSAVELNAATCVLPLHDIASKLVRITQ
ncbi:chemotaxis response regulator protein-glutamate methylesterase [Xylanibacillus composti]|uniref:Protein-glutamate methylesterase/protein-glutamine glutaminase n=1 Tax=Xylanibacillus composti TaxID=1572762 RepID=A0A8J4H0H7_9BACL|nr:chemotaxis response regulator protein-glutamate methylesterase [Xylanibacillus composti]GIQ68624.1 chemotaxis response regulator protein-glutamate methylesterase [Xylanibacillus composti]